MSDLPVDVQKGIRRDTRKHTRHILRPSAELVEAYLKSPSDTAWTDFKSGYESLLKQRVEQDRKPFDELFEQARKHDVFLGCSCPTAKNPSVRQCHTWLALEFMRAMYPRLVVKFPP